MTKRAKLNGEADPIARATPGSYEGQIVGIGMPGDGDIAIRRLYLPSL